MKQNEFKNYIVNLIKEKLFTQKMKTITVCTRGFNRKGVEPIFVISNSEKFGIINSKPNNYFFRNFYLY